MFLLSYFVGRNSSRVISLYQLLVILITAVLNGGVCPSCQVSRSQTVKMALAGDPPRSVFSDQPIILFVEMFCCRNRPVSNRYCILLVWM